MHIPINVDGHKYLNKKISIIKQHIVELTDEKWELVEQGDIRENSGLDIVNESLNVMRKKLNKLEEIRDCATVVVENIAKVGSRIVLADGTKIILTLFKTLINREELEIYISSELKMARDIFYKKEGDVHTYSFGGVIKNTTIKSIIDLGDMFETIEI